MNNGRMNGNAVNIGGLGGNRFFIDWQLASQSISGNSSRINWQAKFHYNGTDAQLDNGNANLSGGRWSNGGRVRNFAADFRSRTVTLASGSFTIGHNSNGTRSLSVSGGVDVYLNGRSSGSQSFSLPTIPRNSQVTSPSSATLGDAIRINTNRKSSSFTHTITLRMHNSGGTVLQTINSVGASTTWTPSPAQITQMQNAIPSSNSLILHITQRNNQVGQNSTTTTRLNLTNANPEFSNFTYKDSSSTATITGNDQVLVKGKSTLEVTVPSADKMVALKGSSPDYYAVAYDGVSNNEDYSASDVTSSFTNIDTIGSRAILVTAYDSRKNNTRVAKNVQVYDYTPPNIEIEVSRENNFGDNVTVETGGTFDLLPINEVNKNSLTASSLKYRHREKGTTTWSTYTTTPFTVSANEFSGTNQFITLDNAKEFEFEFQIEDKFGTVTQTAELGRGTPIQSVGMLNGEMAVGIGKVPENGALDVEGDIYSNGKPVSSLGDEHYFTSSGTWTKPAGLKFVIVEVQGGGGRGGGASTTGSNTSAYSGGGGGGGYAKKKYLASELNSTESLTVGVGSGSQGQDGGSSTFKGITADGGETPPNGSVSSQAMAGRGGNGGSASGGDLNIHGGSGANGANFGGGRGAAGGGGDTVLGSGGRGDNNTSASGSARGLAGNLYGGGGGGAGNGFSSSSNPGMPGADGVVIVHEYF